MSVGVKNFQGVRLKEARLARGLFKNALGDLIGVTGTAITRYEDGEDNPHPSRLDALSTQLKFPVDFFMQPSWPESLDLVHWRSRASESKSAREMTEQRMRWLCEIFEYLESEVDFSETPLPYLDIPDDFNLITGEHIERATMQIRKEWGLRLEPIPDMILALENAGIPTTTLKISSDKQDAFCFRSKRLNRAFVGINVDNTSSARARFDAGHELGHIVLHRHVTPEQARTPASHKLLEQQAHRFAGAMLFPRDSFISEVEPVSLDYFCALKKRWGVAIAAMIMRASDLELIGPETKSILFRRMTKRRWRGPLREPYDTEMPLERPRMLRRGFEAMLNSGIFAKSSILSALPHPVREIEEIASLVPGALSGSEPTQMPISTRKSNMEAVDLETGKVIEFPGRNSKK